MRRKLRSWWQEIKKHRVPILAAIILVAAIALIIVEVIANGTGFTGKTLWDWLGLLAALAIPIVVGFGAAWFSAQQGKASDRENTDNQRESALQTYIDNISKLLLDKNLRDSAEEDEVRKIARVRTLTILPRLDANRKRTVLQFLYESGLIDRSKPIVDLRGADLSGANLVAAELSKTNLRAVYLEGADLRAVDLREADLWIANLKSADLRGATLSGVKLWGANLWATKLSMVDLSEADLREVNLSQIDLSEANLIGAKVTQEQLELAKSLKGATMPDGSKHP